MLDQDFLLKIQSILKRELLEAEKRIKSISLEDPYLDVARLSDNAASDTEASEESGHERVLALKNELNMLIDKIEKALLKISNNTYGKCETCGREIDRKRLEVFPMATFCYDCERRRE